MAKGRTSVGNSFGEPRRRAPRVGMVLFALSLVFFSVNFAQEWLVTHGVQQEAARITREIAQTEAGNADLTRAQAYYSSKPYILRRAREIGMARPGDTLLVYVPGAPQTRVVRVTKVAPAQENVFARVLHAIFG